MEDPPGIHAAAPSEVGAGQSAEADQKTVREPGWFIARGIVAVGGGSWDGGLYGVELDLWPIRFFGIGFELVRGGTTGVSFEHTPDHDSFQTERLRLSGRFDFRGGLAVVTLAGGTARSTRYGIRCPSDNCEDSGEGFVSNVASDIGPSGAIEGGVYLRSDALHMGLVIRGDFTEHVSALTLGPALGVEF